MAKAIKERNYNLLDWRESMSCMDVANCLEVKLPEGFKIVDGNDEVIGRFCLRVPICQELKQKCKNQRK